MIIQLGHVNLWREIDSLNCLACLIHGQFLPSNVWRWPEYHLLLCLLFFHLQPLPGLSGNTHQSSLWSHWHWSIELLFPLASSIVYATKILCYSHNGSQINFVIQVPWMQLQAKFASIQLSHAKPSNSQTNTDRAKLGSVWLCLQHYSVFKMRRFFIPSFFALRMLHMKNENVFAKWQHLRHHSI